ncbi:MAG: hypothetical protein M1570_04480 [Chloroflexi bacterium]|nr:hypothetical protein [Chloroflexota bacterium]
MTLDGARLLDDKASGYTGGAVCVQANGRADIQNTLFTSSQARIGAGIVNYGTAGIVHSTFMTNTATSFGGAIGNYA